MNETKTILIIEDNADSLYLYGEILRLENFNVIETGHGHEALLHLANCKFLPELIIMDLCFPYMTAEEFVQALKSNPKWVKIPILVISGHLETEKRSIALRAKGHIIKPFDVDWLISKVLELTT
jgi:two-component system chemotaxis response regulator CheY